MATDVVVIGGINTDFVARGRELPAVGESLPAGAFVEGGGGKGANGVVAAARLGVATGIIGRVGVDQRGSHLLSVLEREGVDVSFVSRDPEVATGAALIHVDERGQKQVLAALGANRRLSVTDVHAAAPMLQHARVLLAQLEVPLECVVAAVRLAREAGASIVLDPAPPRALPDHLLAMVNVIRGNAHEVEALTGARVQDRSHARSAARTLLARGVEAVVIQVNDGNLLVWRSGEEWLPELPVKRVDVTGGGDAFSAALAVAVAERQTWREAGCFASGAAALTTTALGAQNGLPSRDELETFLIGKYERL